MIGKLLGHSRRRTTADYAHVADAHLVVEAEKVGTIVVNMLWTSLDPRHREIKS